MPLTYFQRIEVGERIMPLIFLAFTGWLCLFDVINVTPGYRAATFLPEFVWGIVFGGAAILQLVATYLRLRRLRRTALFLAAVIWSVWAILLVSVNYRSFGPLAYFSFAVIAFWTFTRIKK